MVLGYCEEVLHLFCVFPSLSPSPFMFLYFLLGGWLNAKQNKMKNGSADPPGSQSNGSSVRASGAGSSSQDPSTMHFSQTQNQTVQEDMAEALKVHCAFAAVAVVVV